MANKYRYVVHELFRYIDKYALKEDRRKMRQWLRRLIAFYGKEEVGKRFLDYYKSQYHPVNIDYYEMADKLLLGMRIDQEEMLYYIFPEMIKKFKRGRKLQRKEFAKSVNDTPTELPPNIFDFIDPNILLLKEVIENA